MAGLHGTEVSFRLGPGTLEEARAISGRLAAAAIGARRHVLFVDAERGEYGCLAEWGTREEAEAYAASPAVAAELRRLAERTGKEPRARLYAMEESPPGA